MQPLTAISPTEGRRTPWPTFADSFIHFPGEPEAWRYFPPSAPEARRAPLTSVERADAYGGLNVADDYLEASKAALRAGDDGALSDALGVLRSIIAVIAGRMRGPSSSENRVLQ
jgi:hypothetical protein